MEGEGVLTMEEILQRYRGKYVAMVVAERDAHGQPARGRVLASHFDRYKLKDMVRNQGEVCLFYAGPAPKEGYLAVL